eukprot:scaffold1019_cov338-Pavlova_lutheri.AAC.16
MLTFVTSSIFLSSCSIVIPRVLCISWSAFLVSASWTHCRTALVSARVSLSENLPKACDTGAFSASGASTTACAFGSGRLPSGAAKSEACAQLRRPAVVGDSAASDEPAWARDARTRLAWPS